MAGCITQRDGARRAAGHEWAWRGVERCCAAAGGAAAGAAVWLVSHSRRSRHTPAGQQQQPRPRPAHARESPGAKIVALHGLRLPVVEVANHLRLRRARAPLPVHGLALEGGRRAGAVGIASSSSCHRSPLRRHRAACSGQAARAPAHAPLRSPRRSAGSPLQTRRPTPRAAGWSRAWHGTAATGTAGAPRDPAGWGRSSQYPVAGQGRAEGREGSAGRQSSRRRRHASGAGRPSSAAHHASWAHHAVLGCGCLRRLDGSRRGGLRAPRASGLPKRRCRRRRRPGRRKCSAAGRLQRPGPGPHAGMQHGRGVACRPHAQSRHGGSRGSGARQASGAGNRLPGLTRGGQTARDQRRCVPRNTLGARRRQPPTPCGGEQCAAPRETVPPLLPRIWECDDLHSTLIRSLRGVKHLNEQAQGQKWTTQHPEASRLSGDTTRLAASRLRMNERMRTRERAVEC